MLSGRTSLKAEAPHAAALYADLFRPLVTIEQAAWMLDEASPRHIEHLIDEGKLRGLNIATREDSRRTLRVWRYSIECRLLPNMFGQPLPEIPAEQVIAHHRPTVMRRELAYWLNCTEQHVSNLNLKGPRDRSDARHIIFREAALDFLTSRTL